MVSGLKAAIGATVLLLAGAAAESSWAQTKLDAGSKSSLPSDGRWGLSGPKKSLHLGGKGRWDVNVDVDDPVNREANLKDVEAGAFFRIAPSLKIGGAVRLGDKAAKERALPEDRSTPRVKLETKFRF